MEHVAASARLNNGASSGDHGDKRISEGVSLSLGSGCIIVVAGRIRKSKYIIGGNHESKNLH